MKTIKTISILLCLVFFNQMIAQHKMTPAEKENAANKVQIFTSTERDNQQIWFYERVSKMELSEETEKEYFSAVLYYVFKMSHLDDKDKGRNKEELLKGIDDYMLKLNTEVEPILTKKQYQIHIESFDTLLKSVYNRMKDRE